VEEAEVDKAIYAERMVEVLREVVCERGDRGAFLFAGGRSYLSISTASGDNATFALRGLMFRDEFSSTRLAAVGPEAPALIDYIMSPACLASASLTDTDKAMLLRIKQDAAKRLGE
jgi:hypothetical protein